MLRLERDHRTGRFLPLNPAGIPRRHPGRRTTAFGRPVASQIRAVPSKPTMASQVPSATITTAVVDACLTGGGDESDESGAGLAVAASQIAPS
jgi:hypothetical protein